MKMLFLKKQSPLPFNRQISQRQEKVKEKEPKENVRELFRMTHF
jgi:hypothetical protein